MIVASICSSACAVCASGLEYRRLRSEPRGCEDCETVDLSSFEHSTDAVVERVVAFELQRSDLLVAWASLVQNPTGKEWCAQAVLTESAMQRAREFAISKPPDPLEDVVVLFIGGQVIDVVLRGELRTGPTLGCFESVDLLTQALAALDPIEIRAGE
jgi:hypothetical protein